MVKIRLRRTGSKKKPSYRVVVADSRSPRDGRFLEVIGHYDPKTNPVTVNIKEDRASHWLSVGAQPSEIVSKLFQKVGVLAKVGATNSEAVTAELAHGQSPTEETVVVGTSGDTPIEPPAETTNF